MLTAISYIPLRLNSTLVYQIPTTYNGSNQTGPIGDLQNGRANICTNGFIDSEFMWGAVERTNSFNHIRMKIIVPKAGNQPIVLNFFKVFKKYAWVMTTLSIFIIIIVFKCVQLVQQRIGEHPSEYSFKNISLNAYRSLLGDSVAANVPLATSIRLVFMSWFIYCFLMSNAFTCKLKSSLVQPGSLDDIDTLDALLNSKIKIMMFRESKFLVEPNVGPQLWTRLNHSLVNGSFFTFEKQFQENHTLAHIAQDYLISYALSKSFDTSKGRPRYHEMAENLLTFPQVYMTELGSPFMQVMNELLGLFYQSGIYSRWTMETLYDNALANQFNVEKSVEEKKEQEDADFKIVISIEHLQMAFYLWAFGLTVSMIVFIVEFVWRKC